MLPFNPESGPKAAAYFRKLRSRKALLKEFMACGPNQYELTALMVKLSCLAWLTYDPKAPIDSEFLTFTTQQTPLELDDFRYYLILRGLPPEEVTYLESKQAQMSADLVQNFMRGLFVD